MSTKEPTVTRKKKDDLDDKIRENIKKYVSALIEVFKKENSEYRDELLKEENNEMRRKFLHKNIPDLKVPEGVKVEFKTKDLSAPRLTTKNKKGTTYRIVDGVEVFKLIKVLSPDETKSRNIKITTDELIDVDMHENFRDCEITLEMPFSDPVDDQTLCEIKYNEQEIVLTTCA